MLNYVGKALLARYPSGFLLREKLSFLQFPPFTQANMSNLLMAATELIWRKRLAGKMLLTSQITFLGSKH